jgi:hypothetical protein
LNIATGRNKRRRKRWRRRIVVSNILIGKVNALKNK